MAKRKKNSGIGRRDGNYETSQKKRRYSQTPTTENFLESPQTITKNSTKIKFDEEGNIQSSSIASSPPLLFKRRMDNDPSATTRPQFTAINTIGPQHLQPPLKSKTTQAKTSNRIANGQNCSPVAQNTGVRSFALLSKDPEYASTPYRKQLPARSGSNESLGGKPYMISVPVDPWSQMPSIRQRSEQNRQRVRKSVARERSFSSGSDMIATVDPKPTASAGKLQNQSHSHNDRSHEDSAASDDSSTSGCSERSSILSSFSENSNNAESVDENEPELQLTHDQQKPQSKAGKKRRNREKIARDNNIKTFNEQAKAIMKSGRELLEIKAAKTITDTGERLDKKRSRNSDEEVAQKREKAKQAMQTQLMHELAQIIPNFALEAARQALEKENRQKSKHKKYIVKSSRLNHDLAVLHAAKSLILRLSAQSLAGQGVSAAAESKTDKDSNNILSQRFGIGGGLTNELARIARGREQRIEMLELEVRHLKERH